jgi:FHA domain/Protein phosphatase 2C
MENETVMRVHPVSDSFEAEDLTNIVLKFTAVCDVSADSSSFFVDRNGAKIGRENTNEIHVPSDTSLAPFCHSILEYSCGKFYLSDCGHNFAASVRIGEGGQRKSWVVQDGTQFSAGTSVFRCAGKSPTGELILLIIEGPLNGQERHICGRTSCTIGRSLDNDICVPDRELSRRHSKVEFDPDSDQYILSDCCSSNGTYVQLVGPNGGRLRINLNDHILVGRTGFSINRYDFGVSEEIGHRKTMEDSCTIKQHLNIIPLCVRGFSPQSFFGVFDGHGGTEASHYLSQNLHINVTDGLLAVSEQLLTELKRSRSGRRSALEVQKKEFDGVKGRYLTSPLGVSAADQELPHDDSLPGSPLSLTPPPPNHSHPTVFEDSLDSIVIKSLKQSFMKTDDDFIRTSEHPHHGSTATTAIVLGTVRYLLALLCFTLIRLKLTEPNCC